LRLAGQGTPVLIVEFCQGGSQQGVSHPRVLGQNLTWMRCDSRRRLDHLPLDAPLTETETESIKALWAVVRQALCDGSYGLCLLDDLDRVIARNLITAAECMACLSARSEQVEVLLAGASFPQTLLEQADQVTHCRDFRKSAGESKLGAVPPA
jgi:cob(I)alamin adenosyltransferase